jgi:hypothetical protein
MQNRILIGAVAGAVVFGGAFAFAADISLTSDNLGADTVAVTACENADVEYDVSFDAADNRYEVDAVRVDLTGTGCTGQRVGVTLRDTANNELGDAEGAPSTALAVEDNVQVNLVTKADVVVYSDPGSTSAEDDGET